MWNKLGILALVLAVGAVAAWAIPQDSVLAEKAAPAGVKVCCAKNMACCSPRSACCDAQEKLGCCAKGMACCEKDLGCCRAVQPCCAKGMECCEQGLKCCGPKESPAAAEPSQG